MASLLKGTVTLPRWQVTRMWLGGLESHLPTNSLWALMHINGIGYCHTPTTTLLEVKEHWKFFTINTKLPRLISKVCNVTGSRLLPYQKNTWLRTIYCLQIILWENMKFQQGSWSATILHREDVVQAGCD